MTTFQFSTAYFYFPEISFMTQQPLFLLVDDDPDDIMLLKDVIHSINHNIRFAEAHDGRAALNYLRVAKENHELPSLVVLDINMPLLNGREIIAMIQEQQELEKLPLVVFSTSSYPGDIAYCSTHGVELITKPFGMKLLIEIAEKLVSRYS